MVVGSVLLMGAELKALSDDDLVEELVCWAGRVAAGEAKVLLLLGEVDARGLWASWGAKSCAAWAAWKLGLGIGTARQKVRVARALRSLLLVAAELAAGRVSYAQVRAITRIATPVDERQWLELARYATGEQLEQAVRGVRRARRDRKAGRAPEHQDLRIGWDEDGALLLTVRIAPSHAPQVLAVVEASRLAEQGDRDALYAALAEQLIGEARDGSAEPRADDVDGSAGSQPDGSAGSPSDGSAGSRSEGSAGSQVDGSAGSPFDGSAGPSAPPYAEPYDYQEPPFPQVLIDRLGSGEPFTEQHRAAQVEWETERDRRRALRDASRLWEDYLQAQADARRLPTPYANLADGLVRALTRPASLKPVVVKLLTDPVSGWGRIGGSGPGAGEWLPPSTLRQIAATLPGRGKLTRPSPGVVSTQGSWARFDLGRRNRTVSVVLRELLGQVDGERCRFPSCTATRNLHAHHVVFWRDGGKTDLANLVLVCSRHHTLIHTMGFQLVLSPDRTLTVRTAGDIPVPHHPPLPHRPASELDPSARFHSEWVNDPFDLGYVVHVMCLQSS